MAQFGRPFGDVRSLLRQAALNKLEAQQKAQDPLEQLRIQQAELDLEQQEEMFPLQQETQRAETFQRGAAGQASLAREKSSLATAELTGKEIGGFDENFAREQRLLEAKIAKEGRLGKGTASVTQKFAQDRWKVLDKRMTDFRIDTENPIIDSLNVTKDQAGNVTGVNSKDSRGQAFLDTVRDYNILVAQLSEGGVADIAPLGINDLVEELARPGFISGAIKKVGELFTPTRETKATFEAPVSKENMTTIRNLVKEFPAITKAKSSIIGEELSKNPETRTALNESGNGQIVLNMIQFGVSRPKILEFLDALEDIVDPNAPQTLQAEDIAGIRKFVNSVYDRSVTKGGGAG